MVSVFLGNILLTHMEICGSTFFQPPPPQIRFFGSHYCTPAVIGCQNSQDSGHLRLVMVIMSQDVGVLYMFLVRHHMCDGGVIFFMSHI